jgi:23S rRNA (guanosine2251-2'-O)-methyltransferase
MDHIEDPQNYGAILRSADAFGADLVVTAKNRAAPLSEAAARASAGASAHVKVAAVTNLPRALGQLAEAGFWIYAADMDGSPLPSAKLPERFAIVLGSEGSGVSRLVAECCDGSLAIPMGGHVDSLNVSVSAAIFLYEYRRHFPRL